MLLLAVLGVLFQEPNDVSEVSMGSSLPHKFERCTKQARFALRLSIFQMHRNNFTQVRAQCINRRAL